MVNSFRSLDLPDFAWRTDREGVGATKFSLAASQQLSAEVAYPEGNPSSRIICLIARAGSLPGSRLLSLPIIRDCLKSWGVCAAPAIFSKQHTSAACAARERVVRESAAGDTLCYAVAQRLTTSGEA